MGTDSLPMGGQSTYSEAHYGSEGHSKAEHDELERMEDMEHRFHLLEKRLKEERSIMELLASLLFEVLRSIPLPSILAITPTVVGAFLLISDATDPELPSVFAVLGAYFPAFSWFNAYTLAVASVCASGVAVLAAFFATGATREYIFGHQAHNTCMWCLQTIAGPCVFNTVSVFLSIVFLLLFLLLEGRMLPSFAVTWVMEGACKAGPEARDGVAEALAYYKGQTTTIGMEKRIDAFCKDLGEHTLSFDSRVTCFILGVTFVIIGVLWQLALHIPNSEKVAMSEDLDEEQEREAIQVYYAHHGHHYGAA